MHLGRWDVVLGCQDKTIAALYMFHYRFPATQANFIEHSKRINLRLHATQFYVQKIIASATRNPAFAEVTVYVGPCKECLEKYGHHKEYLFNGHLTE